jgi:hypothetical protein
MYDVPISDEEIQAKIDEEARKHLEDIRKYVLPGYYKHNLVAVLKYNLKEDKYVLYALERGKMG